MSVTPLHRRPIASLMTCVPYSIPPETDLDSARRSMERAKIRHLPVIQGSQLLGVVSARDLAILDGLEALDTKEMTVAEALTGPPTTALADEPMSKVVARMIDQGSDACVVFRDGLVVGVLTHTDLLHSFMRVLGAESSLPQPEAVRTRILAEHERIRRLLDHLEALATRFANGEHEAASGLLRWARELGIVMKSHMSLEERILAPALREADAFGEARANHFLHGHEAQRALLDRLVEDLDTRENDAALPAGVMELVRAVRDDMVEEERDFLSEELLHDSVVAIEFGG
jgi:CBS domain-containing protein/hemerythrin-like domain-containing protein